MKIKLSNVLRGKERKKQRNKCRKNNIMFKKLKIRIIKKRKEKNIRRKRKTLQNCKSPTQREKFIKTVKSVTEYTHVHIHP